MCKNTLGDMHQFSIKFMGNINAFEESPLLGISSIHTTTL